MAPEQLNKIIVIILGAGLIIAGGTASFLYVKYNEQKNEYEHIIKEKNKNISYWKNKYTNLQSSYDSLQSQYNTLQSNYDSLQNQYNRYKNMVNMRLPSGEQKRAFITPDDETVKTKTAAILGSGFNGKLSTANIRKLNDWIYEHIKYNHDIYVGGKGHIGKECWQYPNETLKLGYGDCEDHALLLLSMMLAEEKVGWAYCAEVEFTKGNEKMNHVCVFLNIENDELYILDPTWPTQNLFDSGAWESDSSKSEPKALHEYYSENGFDSIRVKSVFNQYVYKTFSSNEEFYNWF